MSASMYQNIEVKMQGTHEVANLKLFEDLPVYKEDLAKVKAKKERETSNCMQTILLELMNERGLKDVDVVKATGIPWPTWHDWISGEVKTQMTDDNLKKVMQFFNVHLEYLVYGIGNDDPVFNNEESNGSNKTV